MAADDELLALEPLEEHEIFDNEYWKLNRVLLQIIGMWPYHKKSVKRVIRIVQLGIVFSMATPQAIKLYEEWGQNFTVVTENACGLLYFYTVVQQYFTSIIQEEQFQVLYETVARDWKKYKGTIELTILGRSCDYGRFLTRGYLAYVIGCGAFHVSFGTAVPVFLNLVMPLNESRPKVLCYFAEYYIDQDAHFALLWFHTAVAVLITVVMTAAIESVYANSIRHVVGLFEISEYYLEQAFKISQNERQTDEDQAEIHQWVLKAIKMHQQSLRLADQMSDLYITYFFLCVGGSLTSISLVNVVIMVAKNTKDFSTVFRLFFLWIGMVNFLTFLCHPAQQLIDSSLKIQKSVYASGWYKFPIKTQKFLVMMILRSAKPCLITAGPLLVMNMENLGVILKASVTYCTFVISANS